MSKLKTLAVNSISNVGVRIAFNLFSLITLPLYIKVYGDSLYGIFLIILSIVVSFTLFDFGVARGLSRYVAEYTADKDKLKLRQAVSVSILILFIMAILFSVSLWIISFYAIEIFNIPAQFSGISKKLFQIAAIYSFLFWISRFTDGILEGYQLFVLRNINQTLFLLTSIIIYFLVLFYKPDFVLFVVLMLLSRLLPVFLDIIIIVKKKLLSGIPLVPQIDSHIFRTEFFKYSINLFLVSLIALFAFQSNRIVISTIMSVSFVTIYVIVTKPMFIIRMINGMIFSALGPMIAKENRLDNQRIIKEIIYKGSLVHSILAYPLAALLILFIDPFINLWMGPKYSEYVLWGAIAGIIFFFIPFSATINRVLLNTGHVKPVRNINFFTVLLNFTISVILTFYLGIGGVIIGSLVQSIVQIPFFIKAIKKIKGFSINDLFSKYIFYNIFYIALCSVIIKFFTANYIIDNWFKLIFALSLSTIFICIYGIFLLFKFKILKLKWMSELL